MNEHDVVYDWNVEGLPTAPRTRPVALHDETIRDGIQSPSVHDPTIEQKQEIIRLLAQLGVWSSDLGLPGAGPRAVADVTTLVTQIRDERLPLRPAAAGRTHVNDIRPIVDIAEKTGVPIEIMAFLGSSPIRMYAEGWDDARLEQLTREAVRLGVAGGCPFSFVTEDTVRSHPDTLRRLFTAAVEEGADRLVLCDTVGCSTPTGVTRILTWTDALLRGLGVRERVAVDWHGHNDRGLALANTLAAVDAGADRVHGTLLGVGERVGNTALDQLIVNLKLLGVEVGDVSALARACALVSEACRVPTPVNYPVMGRDAFRTATGVHAAAVVKAESKGDAWLSDRIYSGVPASWFGRAQEIEIGHQSGLSNVRYWLSQRGLRTDEVAVQTLFDLAKRGNRTLEEHELRAALDGLT